MGEQRQIRSRSWNRMPTKRCTANGVTNEFILVDDDEVIILDFPESSKSTSRTGNESILQRVISIDDDDDDTENVHKAGTSGNLQTSAQVDNDDCQFIHEKCADFRFSRCQQQDFSSGIRFGLASESESDFSDSDCSDCEIFEGSDREVREQWEKASSKKMKKAGKAGLSEEAGPSNPKCDANFGPGFKSRTEQHDQTSFLFQARNPDGGKETSSTFFTTGSRNHNTSPFGFFSKPDFPGPSSLTPEVQVEHERSDLPPTEFTWKKAPTHENSFKEVEEQPDTVQVRCETSQSSKENQNAAGQTCDGVSDTTPQSNGARRKHGISSLGESREPIIDSITSTSGHMQGLHGTAPEVDIILNREMLKETDEYKKAQEEEWESRQRQLQLQAEESQRQRKRIKLANKRQLEMERRQKERVEEVRETQKKDEESMNMKEKVRAEITKSLKLLELKSFNMASLLRGLGIPVGGGASPLPHEVHAAYKRAVLKFHPDRASRGDIKQQVEAEEKFKLIARMKDKFLL